MPLNSTYQSYLLRLWRDNPQTAWRASLQSTSSGETYVFAETAALLDFLLAPTTTERNKNQLVDQEPKI